VLGTTTIDHGAGPVTVFEGGDERFLEISTTAELPSSPVIEVCLPMPPLDVPSDVRPVYVLHGEGADPTTRVFVDRTSRVDPVAGKACAAVESFSRFAVATSDVCGNGQRQSDGLVTVAGGLRGRKTVVVDGLTDCTLYPANLPRGLAPYCVPDADSIPGQCTVSLVVGVNRAGCNRVAPGLTAYSAAVDVTSYSGSLRHGSYTADLTALVGASIAALSSPQDAIVGPFDVALPVSSKMTTYKLRHELSGVSPTGSGDLDRDRDALLVRCIDPTQF